VENGARTHTEYIKEPYKFLRLVLDPMLIIHSVEPLNDQIIMLQYSEKRERLQPLPHESQVTGIFTTSLARIRLLETLEELGERVLYMDTGTYFLKNDNFVTEFPI